jgi:phosphate transport system permease protein
LLYRYDIRDPSNPLSAERRQVFPDDVAVTAVAFLNGEQALVVGGSNGAIDVFMRTQPEGSATGDGFDLARAHVREPQSAPIIDISVAQRDESMVMTDTTGALWFRHSTSDQVLFRFERSGSAETGSQALIFPRSDWVLKVDDLGVINSWQVDSPHPEVTLGVLFGRIWYEGYAEPRFIWQSAADTDTFEPKYSLVPLVFGTLKTTFYAMLFALPISLMGAIYTSGFVCTAGCGRPSSR